MPEPEYTAAERQRIEALDAALEESDNYDDENQFQQELEDLEAAAVNRQLTPEFKAGLGIVVSMSRDGSDFYIQRAIGKVEDLPKTRSQDADVTNENGVITLRQPDIKADAFSANLVETLSAERSLVTQAVLATSPKVSMALLTWTFCREVFEGDWCTGVQAPLCINLHQQTWTLQSNAPSGREGRHGWRFRDNRQHSRQCFLRTGNRILPGCSNGASRLSRHCWPSAWPLPSMGCRNGQTAKQTAAHWTCWKPRSISTCTNGGNRPLRTISAKSAKIRLPMRCRSPDLPNAPATS
jgi:hypothetical protein